MVKFYEKLQLLRKNKGMSQEMVAEIFDVSRQAVSRWESGQVYPETEKLIAMSDYFGVSLDELVKDGQMLDEQTATVDHTQFNPEFQYMPYMHARRYEYKSQKTLWGRPLVHISIGWGAKPARGIIAIGNIANGIVSLGLISMGIVSFGLLSFGLISIATFAFALLFAVGAIAVGGFAIGAVAIGFWTLGAVAIGAHARGAVEIIIGR